MSGIRPLGAFVAASLLLPIPGRARPDVIGIVVSANRARVGTVAASEGSSVFDGERLSTARGGALSLRSDKTQIYLGDDSCVIVRSRIDGSGKRLETELAAGEVVLSSVGEASAEILVQNARIRPEASAAGIVQVQLLGPKTLNISARRGTVNFSYRGEDAVIAEGKSYRVELDPPDGGSAGDEKTSKRGTRARCSS